MKYVVKYRIIEEGVSKDEITVELEEDNILEFTDVTLGIPNRTSVQKSFCTVTVKKMSARLRIGSDAFALLVNGQPGEDLVLHRIRINNGLWMSDAAGEELVIHSGDQVTVAGKTIEFTNLPERPLGQDVDEALEDYKPQPSPEFKLKSELPLEVVSPIQEDPAEAPYVKELKRLRRKENNPIRKLLRRIVYGMGRKKTQAGASFMQEIEDLGNNASPYAAEALKFKRKQRKRHRNLLKGIDYGTDLQDRKLGELRPVDLEPGEEWDESELDDFEIGERQLNLKRKIVSIALLGIFVVAPAIGMLFFTKPFHVNDGRMPATPPEFDKMRPAPQTPPPARTQAPTWVSTPVSTPASTPASTPVAVPTPEPTPEPTPAPTAAPTPEPAPSPLPSSAPAKTVIPSPIIERIHQTLVSAMLGSDPMTSVVRNQAEFFGAVRNGDLETLKELVDSHRIDPDRVSENGASALMQAAYFGRTDVQEFLVESKVNVNRKDRNGATALMYAVRGKSLPSVKYLLNQGANPALRMRNGNRAIDIAKKAKFTSIFKLLQQTRPK